MNPIRRLKHEMGLTMKELAEMLGYRENRLYIYQRGNPWYLSSKMMNALYRLGLDAIELQREYVEWRKKNKKELIVQ